jgi:hypothetical protein
VQTIEGSDRTLLVGTTDEGPEGGLSPDGRDVGTEFLDETTGRVFTDVADPTPRWLVTGGMPPLGDQAWFTSPDGNDANDGLAPVQSGATRGPVRTLGRALALVEAAGGWNQTPGNTARINEAQGSTGGVYASEPGFTSQLPPNGVVPLVLNSGYKTIAGPFLAGAGTNSTSFTVPAGTLGSDVTEPFFCKTLRWTSVAGVFLVKLAFQSTVGPTQTGFFQVPVPGAAAGDTFEIQEPATRRTFTSPVVLAGRADARFELPLLLCFGCGWAFQGFTRFDSALTLATGMNMECTGCEFAMDLGRLVVAQAALSCIGAGQFIPDLLNGAQVDGCGALISGNGIDPGAPPQMLVSGNGRLIGFGCYNNMNGLLIERGSSYNSGATQMRNSAGISFDTGARWKLDPSQTLARLRWNGLTPVPLVGLTVADALADTDGELSVFGWNDGLGNGTGVGLAGPGSRMRTTANLSSPAPAANGAGCLLFPGAQLQTIPGNTLSGAVAELVFIKSVPVLTTWLAADAAGVDGLPQTNLSMVVSF